MAFPFTAGWRRRARQAARLNPADHVVATVHGARTVLLDARGGHYYGLDEVGSRIWALLQEGATEEELAARLAEEYDADINRLRSDVAAFVNQMRKQRLVIET